MNVVHVDEYLDENQGEIILIPSGDWHLGASDCAEEKLREDMKYWAGVPNARLLLMGDLMELIDYRDKRFFPHGLPERYADALLNSDGGIASESVQHALEILDPWIGSGRIWGIVTGNHERKLEITQSRNLTAEVAKEAHISHRQLGYGGYVHVSFRVRDQKKATIGSLVIHAHHGWQTAGRAGSGNLLNGMERELGYSNADIFLRGHSHAPRVAQVVPSLRVERTKAVEWPRVIASTGTYKRGSVKNPAGHAPVDTYESFKGFRGRLDGGLGPPSILIRAKNRDGKSARARFDYEVTV
jgi:hypothetical protein